MPLTVSHALSMTTPDNPAYENQPQHWNSAHALTLSLVGSEVIGAFSNANGISFADGGEGFITASYTVPSVTQFLTTAMASNRGTDFVQATAAFAGTNASGTIASNGISVSVGNYITTAMLSNRGTDFVQAAAAFAGTSASGTINSTGISVSIGPYITTGALSNHSHGNPTLALTNLTGTTASASNGFTLSLSAGNYLTTARASTDAIGLNTAQTNVTWTVNSAGISLNAGAYLTTARASNDALGLNTAQTNVTWTANSAGLSFNAAGYAGTGTSATNATFTLNSLGLALSVANPGGAGTLSYFYEPFDIQDGTGTMTGSLSQLNLQPFVIPDNLSFGQINFIGIATVIETSASNSHSARITNSTQRYTFGSSYTIGNTNIVDLFLFSRGSGVFSSELETFASTRNSFATNYLATYNGGATLTNTAGGSVSGSQTVSITISYPFLTSYTSTSVNPASSYTGWSSGYTTWASAANNNSTFTFSTSAARTLSIASTHPATVGWSGAKMINMNFATSLSAGEYWLGYLRHSSSSSSSSSANAFTGAAGTGNSYSATFNHTAFANTQQLTFVGKTATIINSLGSLGFVTTGNMAIEPGLGTFSGTWASNTTYLNNLGNPAGAIALTQIRSNVSFFRSWFRMQSNIPV